MATYQNSGLLYLNTDIRGSAIRDIFKPATVEKNGYVYCVWEDWEGNTVIAKININNTSDIVQDQVAPRSDYLSDIEHATPTMCIDNDGYIYVFYGSHNTQQYYRKSSSTYDISSWSSRLNLTGATLATYPIPLVLKNNNILVFYRQNQDPNSNRNLTFVKSTNGGSNWSSPTTVIQPTTGHWTYPISVVAGDEASGEQTVHIQFALREDGTANFTRCSYLVSNDEGSTWSDAGGNAISIPVDTDGIDTNNDIVIDTGFSYPGDLELNSSNEPYLIYNQSKTFKFASYSTQWDIITIASIAELNYEHGEMDVVSDSIIDVYLVDGTSTNIHGGDIERWRSTDSGATWSLAEQITNDANTGFRYYFPKVVKDSTGAIKLIYQGGVPRASYAQPAITRLYTYPTASLQNISPDKNLYFDISSLPTENKATANTKGRTDYSEAYKNRHGVDIIQGEWSNDDISDLITLGAVPYGDYEDGTFIDND